MFILFIDVAFALGETSEAVRVRTQVIRKQTVSNPPAGPSEIIQNPKRLTSHVLTCLNTCFSIALKGFQISNFKFELYPSISRGGHFHMSNGNKTMQNPVE